jgi:hypothetical protein
VKEEIAKTFREGDKATMVHRGGNKAGRFLEVSVMAKGGRKREESHLALGGSLWEGLAAFCGRASASVGG